MEFRAQNKPNLLNFQFGKAGTFINNETNFHQIQLHQKHLILDPEYLNTKRDEILRRTTNDPETEKDFRRICSLYKNQKSAYKPQLKKAYKEYVSAYCKITSLYWLDYDPEWDQTILCAYDTEKGREKMYELTLPELLNNKSPTVDSHETCIALLPNGELFCFGDRNFTGITLIIDKNNKVRVLPSGVHCMYSSAIYFNRNVYCFGGTNDNYYNLALSARFDLDKNKWFNLTQMPIYDNNCYSVVLDGKILIYGSHSSDILVYSIDVDSFSTIPYEFIKYAKKIIINAERLNLIEYDEDNCIFIYESEAGDEYSWNKIANSSIGGSWPMYCSYNKKKINVLAWNYEIEYYEFNLI